MNHPVCRHSLSLLTLAIASSTAAAQSYFSQHGEILIAAGDQVPGLPAGLTIYAASSVGLDSPSIDQNGNAVFRARFADVGGTGGLTTLNDRGILFGRTYQDLQVVVRSDDPAPGIPGATLRSSAATGSSGLNSTVRISPFNKILFFASSIYDAANPTATPTTSDTALFWGPVGTYVPIAREGEEVPFYPAGSGILWGQVTTGWSGQYSQINSAGVVLQQTPMTGNVTTNDDVVTWTGTPGNLQIVSREGDVWLDGSVLTVESGTTMSYTALINEPGMVLHTVKFLTTSGTATTANDRALSIWINGTENIIAREGQQAPGLAPGVLFADATNGWTATGISQFTKSGTTTLNAALYDGGATISTLNDRAIFYGGLNGWAVIMQEGDPVPGMPGVTFGPANDSSIACNDSGGVVFLASLVGTPGGANDDSGLFYSKNGVLTMLAQEGQSVVADGLPSGWIYDSIASGGTATPRLTENGMLLWQPSIWDGVSGLSGKTVVLGWTEANGFQCFMGMTDPVTTSLGTSTPFGISSLGSYSGSDGAGTAWVNNNGDFTAKLNFQGTPALQGAIIRGHVGVLQAKPGSIDVVAGGSQSFTIHAGPGQAFRLYGILGTLSGTRPGIVTPLGPQLLPLNPDFWTQLSLDLAGSIVYPNSLWFTDANGNATAGFNLPPGITALQGSMLHHAAILLDGNLSSTYITEPTAVHLY